MKKHRQNADDLRSSVENSASYRWTTSEFGRAGYDRGMSVDGAYHGACRRLVVGRYLLAFTPR
jgi:hypothetical protein